MNRRTLVDSAHCVTSCTLNKPPAFLINHYAAQIQPAGADLTLHTVPFRDKSVPSISKLRLRVAAEAIRRGLCFAILLGPPPPGSRRDVNLEELLHAASSTDNSNSWIGRRPIHQAVPVRSRPFFIMTPTSINTRFLYIVRRLTKLKLQTLFTKEVARSAGARVHSVRFLRI